MPTAPPPEDTWLWDSSPVPASRPGVPIRVTRYKPAETDPTKKMQVLTNLQCVEIQRRIGSDPGHASFRYVFDGSDPDSPQSIEEALDVSAVLPNIVEEGDSLLVHGQKPGGTWEILFYGNALSFGMDINDQAENVHIIATGYARVAWDTPIAGAYMRDSANIDTGDDLETDVVAAFNPKGEPNATDQPSWVNASTDTTIDQKYPTFLDPAVVRTPDIRKKWTLAKAARYLIYRHIDPSSDIRVPAGADIDSLLVAQEPVDGATYDPLAPGTYTTKDISVTDRPITGRDWPTVLDELLRDKGFAMYWQPGEESGLPIVTLMMIRTRATGSKDLFLPTRGTPLDPEQCNVGSASIDRDINGVVNRWRVVGRLNRFEASFVLAPGFPIAAADAATIASLQKYEKNDPGFADVSDNYRIFVFDETGEGHYLGVGLPENKDVNPLDEVLGTPDSAGTPKYVNRRRKPIGELISTDANDKPLRYSLAVSKDSTQTVPGVWDRTGTWQEIDGGYALLKDRLGIRITVDNPNKWKIGQSNDSAAPFRSGILKVVQSLAAPDAANPAIRFRLTCVIEGDQAVEGDATRTDSSPVPGTITRIIDARDRYRKDTVCTSSSHNDGGADITVRDDSEDAKAEATANRVATECGVLSGTVTIPRFTGFYQLGDRIRQITGRNLGLRTDGGGTSTTAVYPNVVAVRHMLGAGQMTAIEFNDQDGHRHRLAQKARRPR